MYPLDLWFSTADSWRPTKQNKTQFRDLYSVLKDYCQTGFGDPKVSARDPKVDHDPPVEKHCTRDIC